MNLAAQMRSSMLWHLLTAMCLAVSVAGCKNDARRKINTAKTRTAQASGAHFYSTAFPRTENPIHEGGMWVGGSDAGASIFAGGNVWNGGRLWGDVQTASGLAYGVDEPTQYGDPTAILTGTWGPGQTVTATVRIEKTPIGQCCHEVELRLRSKISLHRITGYEAYCSVMPDNTYCHIARWNGPAGSFWNIDAGKNSMYLADGDVMKATATGSNPTIITLYRNGVKILQATDTGAAGGGSGAYGPWTSGNPGFGFYDNSGDDHWKDFGFSRFSASDMP